MFDFLTDKKNQVALAGFLATILLQVAKSKGVAWIDPETANAITGAVVLLAVGLMGSHAHVEHGETMADAHVEAAQLAAPKTP